MFVCLHLHWHREHFDDKFMFVKSTRAQLTWQWSGGAWSGATLHNYNVATISNHLPKVRVIIMLITCVILHILDNTPHLQPPKNHSFFINVSLRVASCDEVQQTLPREHIWGAPHRSLAKCALIYDWDSKPNIILQVYGSNSIRCGLWS